MPEAPTTSLEPGRYLVKREKKYLAVKEDGSVDVLAIAHPWIISIHNGRTRLKDPGTGNFLYDNSTAIVLDPGQNKHSQWEGASMKKHTKLVNDGTENNLNFPYDEEGDTWIFEKAD